MSYCVGCGCRTAKREVAGQKNNVIIIITCPECDRVVLIKYGKEGKGNEKRVAPFNPPHGRTADNVHGNKVVSVHFKKSF